MESPPKARLLLQQCLSARLQVEPPTDQKEGVFVEIGRGLILYVCFLKGANSDTVNKMVKEALNTKLSTGADGKLCSILDLPGDVLIIPQATLGGCLKGKSMQYHRNIAKEEGLELYKQFTLQCEETVRNHDKSGEAGKLVKWGTYGNVQVFRCDTNGPYSHLLEY